MNAVPTIRLERLLPHGIERVWRAITDPTELAAWFVAPVEWTPAVGERLAAFGQEGEVTLVEPPHRLAWTFGVERYAYELAPAPGGTRLVFEHVPNPDLGPAEQHESGWRVYFGRLEAHLDGRAISEAEAHVALLEDGPSVRLERRLPYPLARVWRAVTEDAELEHWYPDGGRPQVIVSDPPHMVAWDFGGDRVRIDLRPDGEDATVLQLTHVFDERAVAARNAAGWAVCLVRLRAALDGVPLDERTALADWPAVHEELATRWSLDPEVGRAAWAAHPAAS
jgi:uncharacterized protein YndB with AHSA1/START domain